MTIRFTSSTIIAAAMATSVSAFTYQTLIKSKPKPVPTTATTTSSMTEEETFLLVGDIGGTNTRLAIYPASNKHKNDLKTPIFLKEYLNEKYITDETKSFEHDIFLPFLSECSATLTKTVESAAATTNSSKQLTLIACIAFAGPVKNNRATITNLQNSKTKQPIHIEINGTSIEQNTYSYLSSITKCIIINDFVGQGYGLLDLDLSNPNEVMELTPNSKQILEDNTDQGTYYGPKACVGAGTGLGECFLTTSSLHPEEGYECYPSEGGHVDFVPRDDVQIKLLDYLKTKFDATHRVSVERVVSGKGLANIYEFLSTEYPNQIDPILHQEFQSADALQGKVIGVNANQGKDANPLCKQAMEIMMSAYGSEVGNVALKYIPTGGLYVSGGLTPKNIDFISGLNSPFMKAYHDKGRMSRLLENIPLFAVLVEDLGLRGARVCAMREYKNLKKRQA